MFKNRFRFLFITAFKLILAIYTFSISNATANIKWPESLHNECNHLESSWIWCEDFELDRSYTYTSGQVDRKLKKGLSNSYGAAFHFPAKQKSGGGIRIFFGRTPSPQFKPVDSGIRDYQEIYWRMFVFTPENWVGNGADKLSRATIITNKNWSQAMIAHVWSGKDPGPKASFLVIDPASGIGSSGKVTTTKYNDFANLQWLGYLTGKTPIFSKEYSSVVS